MKTAHVTAILLMSLTFLTSCGADQAPDISGKKLSDSQWCQEVWDQLVSYEVGWPVANRPLNHHQIVSTEQLFTEYSTRGSEDLNFASKVWVEKFKIIAPYLESNDLQGFQTHVSEHDKKAMQLSNIALANSCQWRSDET